MSRNASARRSKSNFRAAIESLEDRRLLSAVNPSIITMFMGYTAADVQQTGSVSLLNDKINRAIQLLNQTLANSKVLVSVRLVGTLQTNYVESGSGDTDLAHLDTPTDPQLMDVKTAAIAAGADVTDLIVTTAAGEGGITAGDYNIILLQYLDNGVLSHEFGHTLGAGHPHVEDTNNAPAAYEGTLQFGNQTYYGAVGGNLNYYSNPDVYFDGVPTGIGGFGATAANNALYMNQAAPIVAAANPKSATAVPDTTGPTAELGSIFAQNTAASTINYLPTTGWTATALDNFNPITSGGSDVITNAFDGNLNTRWSTDALQDGNQTFTLDLGSVQTFNTITMDTGPGSAQDYARSYQVYASSDKQTYTPIGTGTGTSELTTLSFPTISARYIQINDTGTSTTNWWSIGEVKVGTMMAAAAPGKVNFQVVYTDGSGVNVASLGNNNIVVTGPNGFSTAAQLLSIDDPSANYGYHLVTYTFNAPSLANLSSYTFNIQANSVSDTVGNFTPAGVVGGPSPLSPDYAGSDFSHAAPVGDLAGVTWQITDEVGGKYQPSGAGLYFDPAIYHFSLSQASTLNVNIPATDTAGVPLTVSVINDANGNLMDDGGSEDIAPSGADTWNLPAGQNYYIEVSSYQAGTIPYALFTMTVSSNLIVPLPATSTISGTVYSDANSNGKLDNGEAGIPIAGVELSGTNTLGEPVQLFSYTDSNGNYSFPNLYASATGGYTLTSFPVYQGAFQLTAGQGTVGSLGGTVSTTTITGINVAAGSNGTGYNFGEIPQPPLILTTLSGQVYIDTNGNQMRDTGEVGVAGAMLTLTGTDTRGNAVNLTAATDANGLYSFTNVPPANTSGLGGYSLSLIQPMTTVSNEGSIIGSLGASGFSGPTNTILVGIAVNGVAGTGYDFPESAITTTTAAAPTANTMTVNTQQNGTTTGNVNTAGTTGNAVTAAQIAKPPATPAASITAMVIPGTGPFHAQSFTFNSNGTFTYTPLKNYYGADSFEYELVNSAGRAAEAFVNINVQHVAQPPTFTTETITELSTNQATPLNVDLGYMVTDADDFALNYKVTNVTGGTASILSDGQTLHFVPSTYFSGMAYVTFTANDGVLSAPMKLAIDVTKIDHGPTAGNLSSTTLPSTAVTLNPMSVSSDPDGMGYGVMALTKPANGTAYINNEGSSNAANYRIVYRPNFGFHGTDTFKYELIDDEGKSSWGSITVKVVPGAGIGIDPTNSSLTALDIFGTSGTDTITIADKAGGVGVTMNNVFLGTFNPTGVIAAFGGSGTNTISAAGVCQSVAIFGGSGNDKLTAGSGNALLVGGGGSDTLIAGNGTDDIIAGSVDYTNKGFGPLVNLFYGGQSLGSYVHPDSGQSQIYAGTGYDTIWAKESGTGFFDQIHNRRLADLVIDLA